MILWPRSMLCLLIGALVGLSAALPLEPAGARRDLRADLLSEDVNARNSALELLILEALEDLRETMLHGGDTMPVLDPWQLEGLHFDSETIDFPGLSIGMEDMTVNYLSTFEVIDLSLTMTSLLLQRYTLEFDGVIPVIDVSARNYDLALSALGADIFGSGEASVQLIELRLYGSLDVGLSIIGGISVTVRAADLKVGLAGFEPNIRGLFGNEGASDFTNAFLRHAVPELVVFYEDQISAFLNNIVPDIANQALKGVLI